LEKNGVLDKEKEEGMGSILARQGLNDHAACHGHSPYMTLVILLSVIGMAEQKVHMRLYVK
jgi:hypothetical protein